MGKQKTASAGAPRDDAAMWNDSDWPSIRRNVRRLQCRIAKAVKEGRWNKVKALQHLLTRSLAAKRLAVRRVTSNKGRTTPGVDGVVWRGARVKGQAIAPRARLRNSGGRSYDRSVTSGAFPSGGPSMEFSSGMTGNCHVPFQGGARGESPQPYPVPSRPGSHAFDDSLSSPRIGRPEAT